MESVMNFLADNYIWFFVAAGILCFALIGFIIESRKKQKNEFKGESIEENTTTEVSDTTNVASDSVDTVAPVEPVQVVGKTVDMNGEEVLGANQNSLEDTMEINDIPLASEENTPSPQPSIEFYSGPIDMPAQTPNPAPVPVTEFPSDEFTMGNVEPNNSEVSATIGNPVSNSQTSNFEDPEPTEVKVVEENAETPENTDIFNNLG